MSARAPCMSVLQDGGVYQQLVAKQIEGLS